MANDWNAAIIEEFRANQGRVGGSLADATIILLHQIGAKSGIERVTPVGCFPQGDGRFAIIASNGGSPKHPDWYYNLKANPRITIELGTETFTVVAEEVDDTTRTELLSKAIAERPEIAVFQARVQRKIPILMLTRQD
jgi:deazaflavin-dependent oxidoreductase (nitroreductase family)